jgi:CRP-like cAMP-binding protein
VALAKEEVYPDGAVLAVQGEAGDRMFVIASGTVRVSAGSEGRVIARRGSGEAVGEMAIVADQPRSATMECEGDVRALTIGRRDFEVILRDRPQVAQAIIRVLCARLAEQARA